MFFRSWSCKWCHAVQPQVLNFETSGCFPFNASYGEISSGSFELGSTLWSKAACKIAYSQKRSLMPASTIMILVHRSKIPHILSACEFCGGHHGMENDLAIANSLQNSSRSSDMNSPPLSVCHLIGLPCCKYCLWEVRNSSNPSRTFADSFVGSSFTHK